MSAVVLKWRTRFNAFPFLRS